MDGYLKWGMVNLSWNVVRALSRVQASTLFEEKGYLEPNSAILTLGFSFRFIDKQIETFLADDSIEFFGE